MSESKRTRLGSFELLDVIGEGGMGEVWQGIHVEQRVPVAIKIVTSEKSRDPRFRRAFREEVRAVARLNHPGIVTVFDYGEISGEAERRSGGRLIVGGSYLAMALASGSLRQVEFPIAWKELKPILMAVLDALAHAHARGVIHRDIKPGNVLLVEPRATQLRTKLTDFGIAHALVANPSNAVGSVGATVGTPHYMPPEQFRGRWRDYGPWTDLYAVGCMVFELVTGAPPFEGDIHRLVQAHLKEPPPRMDTTAGYPDGLEQWVRQLLAKNPHERFERAADAAWALEQLSDVPFGRPRVTLEKASRPLRNTILEQSRWTLPLWQRATVDERGRDQGTRQLPNESSEASTPGPVGVESDNTVETSVTALLAPDSKIALTEGVGHGDPIGFRSSPLPPLPLTWHRGEGTSLSNQLIGVGLGLYGLRTIPLMDREQERDRIWQALTNVVATGGPQLLLLRGSAGVGKSRLAEFITQRAEEVGGATVLTAFHSPQSGPNDGLVGMIARYFHTYGLPRPEVLKRVQTLLRRQGVDDSYEWIAITELLVQSSTHALDGTDSSFWFSQPNQRYALIKRLFERIARQRPLIVWLDDVQWGSDSLAAAEFVLKTGSSRTPLLFLCTARTEDLAERTLETRQIEALLTHNNASFLDVAPLSPTDHKTLVRELLRLEGHLATRVAERTAGNPLFAVQLVGDWVRRGVLCAGGGGFVLNPDERADLPDDLHHVWQTRLERLLKEMLAPFLGAPDETALRAAARDALEIAAVLGQAVNSEEWAGVCAQAGVLLPVGLAEKLIDNSLAKPTNESGWYFVHGMLRESLERQAREEGRWAQHNSACAAFLEKTGNQYQRGFAQRFGRHLVEAGLLERALEPLRQAVDECIEGSDLSDARILLEQRESVLKRVQPVQDTPQWCSNWLFRAYLAGIEGAYDEQYRWAARAERLTAEKGPPEVRASAMQRMANAASNLGNPTEGLELARHAQAIARQSGASETERLSFYTLGLISRSLGLLDDAAGFFGTGIELANRFDDKRLLARCLEGMADTCTKIPTTGHLEKASKLFKEAMDTYQELGDLVGVAICWNGLAEVDRQGGRLDEAEAGYRRALDIHRALEFSTPLIEECNLGLVFLARGDFRSARACFDELQPKAKQLGDAEILGNVLLALGCCAAQQQHWQEGDRLFEKGRGCFEESQFKHQDIAWLAQLFGDLALGAGESTRATRAYQLAQAQASSLGLTNLAQEVERRIASISSAT